MAGSLVAEVCQGSSILRSRLRRHQADYFPADHVRRANGASAIITCQVIDMYKLDFWIVPRASKEHRPEIRQSH